MLPSQSVRAEGGAGPLLLGHTPVVPGPLQGVKGTCGSPQDAGPQTTSRMSGKRTVAPWLAGLPGSSCLEAEQSVPEAGSPSPTRVKAETLPQRCGEWGDPAGASAGSSSDNTKHSSPPVSQGAEMMGRRP